MPIRVDGATKTRGALTMAAVDNDVKALLKEHGYLQLVEVGEGGQKRVRIRCDLTQHELLPRKDAIESYLKTKKFVKAKEWYCYDYSKYEPYIVQHRRKPKSLFCNVTGTILNRIPEEVEKHVKGKKFQRLKEHVNFTKDGEAMEEGNADFDANAFEFENQQLIYSDDEEEEGKPAKKRGGDDDDDEDEDEDEKDTSDDDLAEEEEAEESDEDDENEDDMADFYPKEDEEEPEDEHIREAVKRLTVKKRKASGDATSGDDDEDAEKEASPVKKAKKAKTEAPAKSNEKSGKAMAAKPAKPAHTGKQKKGSKK